jgi:hypothetical protein
MKEGGEDGGGATPDHDGEKAWSSINHLMLSGIVFPLLIDVQCSYTGL